MKTKNFLARLATVLSVVLLSFSACTKNESSGASTLSVFLTDGPGEFEAVNIDIRKVEVKVDNDELRKKDDNGCADDHDKDDHTKRKDEWGEWVDLNYTPAIINVLDLRNGVEAKLGDAKIETGNVRKIRITLGDKNTVVKNGVISTLNLINDTNNYLYIHLFNKHKERRGVNAQSVWVDFDVAKSILEANGQFYLKPVLRPFNNQNFGVIAGLVLPREAKAVVRVSDGAGFDAVALPNQEGKFMLRGLNEGTYTVTFEGIAPFTKQSVSNVKVTKGQVTKLDPVTMK